MVRILAVPVIFIIATLTVWFLAAGAPDPGLRKRKGKLYWTFPTNFDNVTDVAAELQYYKDNHYNYVVTVFIAAYLYKQSFAIPGSFFLNIIAGALFGFWRGFGLACLLSTLGATICYFLSDVFGKQYVFYYFGPKVAYFQQKVEENSNRLFLFLLFARMFPISPSWLLNIIAPFLNVPLHLFVSSVFLGLAPYNFVCVQAGAILSDLRQWEDIFDFWTLVKLSSVASVPLLLALWVRPQINKENSCAAATRSLSVVENV